MKLLPFARHFNITSSRFPSGESALMPGGSNTNQIIVRKIYFILFIVINVHCFVYLTQFDSRHSMPN